MNKKADGIRERILHMVMEKKEVVSYLFFGVLTTLISIASFALASRLMNPLAANVVSWIISVSFAYVTNRRWVFEHRAEGSEILREFLAFLASRLTTLAGEELLLYVGIVFLRMPDLLVKIFAQALVIAGNYLLSKFLVFTGQKS